jgi:AraC family transcriptional regulator
MQSSASPDQQALPRLSSDPFRVEIEPSSIVDRHSCEWPGLKVEIVTATKRTPFEYRFRSQWHLLIAAQRAERTDGETLVEGLPKSTLPQFSGRMTFVPAGHAFAGWQNPRVLTQVSYFYIDPRGPVLDEDMLRGVALRPRLFFHNGDLWHIVDKLKDEALAPRASRRYGDALGVLLGHELVKINGGPQRANGASRGGLSGWQQKRVSEFIEGHLGEELRLTTLAQLVDLSPYHFARAFKRSFGVPPHRYHVGRRIARAKDMLADRTNSVTGIARELGFAETSSFSSTFRRVTGASPSDFRRDRA